MRRILLVTALATVLLSAWLSQAVHAEGGFNVTVFPAKVELTVAPGTSMEFPIQVRQDGTEDQRLKVYFMDYSIKANNEFVFERPGHESYSCAKWLSTDGDELYAPVGRVVTKKFTASVPEGVESGGHYGVVFFEQQPSPGSPPVQARPRIGALVMVTVPGQVIRDGEIKSLSVESAWFWPTQKFLFLPVATLKYRLVFYNRGNVHLTIRGKLTYVPTFGWGSGTVDMGEITVLPKTSRYLEGVLPKPPVLGSCSVKAEVQYGPSLDVFDTTKTKTTGLSTYPLGVILLLVVLVVVIVVIVKLALRLRRARKTAPPGESPKVAAEPKEAEEEDPELFWLVGAGLEEKAFEGEEEEKKEEKKGLWRLLRKGPRAENARAEHEDTAGGEKGEPEES